MAGSRGERSQPLQGFRSYWRRREPTSKQDMHVSREFARGAADHIGGVRGAERRTQARGRQREALREGTVALSLTSATPRGAVAATVPNALTIRVQSALTSAAGPEPIELNATAG